MCFASCENKVRTVLLLEFPVFRRCFPSLWNEAGLEPVGYGAKRDDKNAEF